MDILNASSNAITNPSRSSVTDRSLVKIEPTFDRRQPESTYGSDCQFFASRSNEALSHRVFPSVFCLCCHERLHLTNCQMTVTNSAVSPPMVQCRTEHCQLRGSKRRQSKRVGQQSLDTSYIKTCQGCNLSA
jgi:hypothetical protein